MAIEPAYHSGECAGSYIWACAVDVSRTTAAGDPVRAMDVAFHES